jgi:hypothetical protein
MAATLDYLSTLDDERFHAIYEFLSQDGFGPLDSEVAAALKFRPQAIRKLPLAKRAKTGRSIIMRKKNAELAYELLGGYLFRKDKDLITEFLDAAGIEHDDGMIDSDELPKADDLPKIVATLDGAHDADDVTIYMAICAQTWPEVEQFDALWRERAAARS